MRVAQALSSDSQYIPEALSALRLTLRCSPHIDKDLEVVQQAVGLLDASFSAHPQKTMIEAEHLLYALVDSVGQRPVGNSLDFKEKNLPFIQQTLDLITEHVPALAERDPVAAVKAGHILNSYKNYHEDSYLKRFETAFEMILKHANDAFKQEPLTTLSSIVSCLPSVTDTELRARTVAWVVQVKKPLENPEPQEEAEKKISLAEIFGYKSAATLQARGLPLRDEVIIIDYWRNAARKFSQENPGAFVGQLTGLLGANLSSQFRIAATRQALKYVDRLLDTSDPQHRENMARMLVTAEQGLAAVIDTPGLLSSGSLGGKFIGDLQKALARIQPKI